MADNITEVVYDENCCLSCCHNKARYYYRALHFCFVLF